MIELVDVWKRFDGEWVLKGLSFSVRRGELAVLLGPSGCGKTTTLRVVAGLLRPERGRVYIDGVDVTDSPPRERRVGMVFQSLALFPHLTVRENIAYGLRSRGWGEAKIEKRVRELVELLGLEGLEDRYPRQLSGGQRQRVALARALAPKPKVLLLDEPLTNLDATLRERLRWELKTLQRRLGFTAIYVTHDQSEAMALADKLLVMFGGRIVREGPPEEVYRDPRRADVAAFLGYNVLETSKLGGGWGAKYLAFKPEDVIVSANPGHGLTLKGVVVASLYQKTHYRVKVETKAGVIEAVTPEPLKGEVTLHVPAVKILELKNE